MMLGRIGLKLGRIIGLLLRLLFLGPGVIGIILGILLLLSTNGFLDLEVLLSSSLTFPLSFSTKDIFFSSSPTGYSFFSSITTVSFISLFSPTENFENIASKEPRDMKTVLLFDAPRDLLDTVEIFGDSGFGFGFVMCSVLLGSKELRGRKQSLCLIAIVDR